MKKINLVFMLIVSMHFLTGAQNIEQDFKNPPDSAKPWVYWFWMSGHVTKEGIKQDLEMMSKVGIGGVLIMEVRHHILPDGPVKFSSDEWFALKKYVAEEAGRLGIEVTSHVCEGWSATGGPWVTPEKAIKILTFTEKLVESSGTSMNIMLERPYKKHEYYKDLQILAFPATKGAFKIKDWHVKGLHYKSEHLRLYRLPTDTRTVAADDIVQPEQVIDLTGQMKEDGTLNVRLPKGEWMVLRMGYTNSPETNKPATAAGRGLEIDKFDRSAVDLHWNALIEPLIKASNEGQDNVLRALEIDSYEVAYQNWTKGFEKEFKARCGYDLEPWTPCLAGYVVKSLELSERFLWDFRKVCADLMAENYILYFREKANANNLQLMFEPYGTSVFDGFEMAKIPDIPMGEFWYRRPEAWHEWSTKLASSAAHITGKKVVAAESFTSTREDAAFHATPYSIKPTGDHYFTEGLNRMIFHAWAHQPWNENVKPGMTMAPHGIQLHRNNTWVPKSKEYFEYLSRCQFMLRQGEFCADFLYIFPEDYPNTTARRKDIYPVIPPGYDYDVTNSKTLADLSVKNGRIYTSSGMIYKHLIVPYNRPHSSTDDKKRSAGSDIPYPRNSMRFTPETLHEINRLVKSGASVLSPPPVSSPSLVDYPNCDEVVEKMTKELWESGLITAPEAIADVCKNLSPDFESSETNGIKYIHRKTENADIYFVANRQLAERKITATFRVSGKIPELWDASTGEITSATNWKITEDGRTKIVLNMAPAGSVFVVFQKLTDKKKYNNPKPELREFATLEGPWEITFDPAYGPKKPVTFRYLDEWNNNDNSLIKYFSGSATYKKKFVVNEMNKPVYLDLGDVHFMARVKLNGSDLGLLWKPPYRIEITKALKMGENEVEIEVTNSWINRLIGDEKLERLDLKKVPTWLNEGKPIPNTSKRKTFITHRHYTAKDPLVPSGLMGPVQLKH
ncbi:glycosyl hydrolase [Algibacter pacificus]|uniref:glycosyl hydrolase n=1 Tax=Algibacter pacificus TaxID=2599389 RepID=UPI0011CA2363|nr:glycosyl hydrolase [Algibacter pacificus]